MPSPYTLSDLGNLVAVADAGHVGRAASRCFVTQPTLSMQLKKLEQCLGVPLFERDRKRLVLTEVDRSVVEQARRTLAEARMVQEIADAHRDGEAGQFRLGIIATLGAYFLPWAVGTLRARYPRLNVVVTEGITDDLLASLGEHELDAALLALPITGRPFELIPLFEERFFVTCPVGHVLSAMPAVAPTALQGHRLLLLTEGHCLRDQALEVCSMESHSGSLTADCRATSLETLRQMVASGLGVTLLPALAAKNAISDSRLAVLPLDSPAAIRRIGIALRPTDPRAALVCSIAEVFRANLPGEVSAS